MTEKKIAFITHVGAPGGAEYVMIDLAVSLTKNAEVVCFQEGPLAKTLQEQDLKYKVFAMPESLMKFKREDGVLKMLRSLSSAFIVLPRYANFCRQYDVLLCMSQKAFLLSAITKPFHGKPITWFMNDIVSKDHFSRLSLLVIRVFSSFFADQVVLNSQASLKAWKHSGCPVHKASIIYPGIDISKIQKQISDQSTIDNYRKVYSPAGEYLVGIFGRISPWKGQDVFLKALPEMNNVTGIIVGEAQFGEQGYKTHLRKIVKEFDLSNKVHFLGHIDDVAKVMAACDVIVHASTAPEPYGIVIGEAMASGKPVVASNAGGAKELVLHKETGILTTPGDSEELAAAISYYINNPDFSRKIVAKAQEHVSKRFSLEAMIKSFRELLEI